MNDYIGPKNSDFTIQEARQILTNERASLDGDVCLSEEDIDSFLDFLEDSEKDFISGDELTLLIGTYR